MKNLISILAIAFLLLLSVENVAAQCGATSVIADPQPLLICEFDVGVVTFTAGGTCAGNWEYQVQNGAAVVQAWSTTASYGASPSTTTTYTVYARCSACPGTVVQVDFTVNVVEEPAVAGNLVVCPGTGTTMTASGGFGPYDWWDAPGGNQMSPTEDYTTPGLGADATYYAQATGTVAGSGGSILITECGLEGYAGAASADYLEISNLYTNAVNTTGWVAAVSNSYGVLNSVNPILWNLPSSFNPCSVVSRNDVAGDPNYWGNNILWNPGVNTTYRSWAIIIDDVGNVVDFVAWGWTAVDLAGFNAVINGFNITLGAEWTGNGCDATCGVAGGPQLSIQRIGNTDSNNAGDFVCQASTVDVVNPGLVCGWPSGLTCPFPFTVVVDLPPTASNPAPIVVDCPANVPAANPAVVTDELDDYTASPIVTLFNEVSAGTCPEVITRTYRVTDDCGSYVDVDQTITVMINTGPIVPANGSSTVECLSAATQPAAPAVTDQCGNALTPVITENVNPACEGNKVYTYTYTDCAGNSAVYTYTYTIDMTTPPVVPANGSSTVECLAAATQPAAPAVTDVCGNALTAVITENADPACEGSKVYTYTYTDCSGLVSVYTYTYTIDMTTPPVVPANGSSTVECLAAATQPAAPAVTDVCGNALTAVITENADPACEGSKVYTYTYTDCSGLVSVYTYTYTIDMTTPPVVPPNGSSTVECLAAATQPAAPAVTDVCGNALTAVITENADPACDGSKVYTYTYTDCSGLVSVYTYTYTIALTTAPVIAAANGAEAVVCIGDVYIPTPPAGIVDACGNAIAPVMTENADPVCVGDKIYTFTYTDCAGNASVWTYTFSINDNVPPTANSLPPQTGTPPAWDINDVTGEADNCTVNPTVAWVSDVSDNGVCPEIITRTYSVTDDCGNQILVTQTFTVGDAILPTASNPADINVECAALVPLPNANVVTDEADNGATPAVTFEDDTPGGGVCPDTILRRYRVTDDCGNFIFVTQFIIIEPITNPVVPADGASTVNCLADAQVQPTPPVVTDVCGNTLTPVITTPADIVCEGDMAWVFTYTDCAGNSSVWTYTYTVDLPAFTLPADAASTVNCPADANVQPAGPGVITDLCGNTLTPVITAPAAVACEGDMVWTFTYTDCAANTADWTYTYTVDMPTFAIATPSGASTVNCPADANIQPADAGVVTDLCGNVITPTVTAPAAVACEGDMVWTFTYTDCAGNSVDWIHTYTVDMPTFAIATPNGASTVNCPADANIQPADAGVVTDLCGNVITPTVTAPAAIPCEGDMVWTFTYTDCAGNTIDWTHTYTIDVPAFTIPYADAASTVNCVADAQVDPGDPGVVTDMCGNVLTPVVTAPSPTGCTGVGAIWLYTYTDCAGNTADWTYTYTVNLAPFVIATPNAASTVNCVADANVQPADAGVVNDACGNAITPTVTPPTAVACEGDMVWTFTYTDCAGNTLDWTHTYTVDMPTFAIATPNGASTVNCPADANVQPADAGVVTDICGNVITPTVTAPTAVACEGDMVWTFTYTDCAGNNVDWTHTYTVDMPTFAIATPSGASTVNCPADANIQPADAGVVTDLCGNVITPTVTAPAAVACEGDMVWTFTYTDCAGNSVDWIHTYTVDMPTFAIATPNGTSTVNCPADANIQPADAGVITDICGNVITPTVTAPAAIPCEGDMVWTFTYTDCAGNVVNWTHTYTIDVPTFAIATPLRSINGKLSS